MIGDPCLHLFMTDGVRGRDLCVQEWFKTCIFWNTTSFLCFNWTVSAEPKWLSLLILCAGEMQTRLPRSMVQVDLKLLSQHLSTSATEIFFFLCHHIVSSCQDINMAYILGWVVITHRASARITKTSHVSQWPCWIMRFQSELIGSEVGIWDRQMHFHIVLNWCQAREQEFLISVTHKRPGCRGFDM